MLKAKMAEALNEQINAEFMAHFTYLSMAAYFYAQNLMGFARWLRHHAEEEHFHAMKIYDFIHERGGHAELKALQAPKTQWGSALEVFEDALKHEQHVTELIHKLVDLAAAERDHATASFLKWYVDEQVEEEAIVDAVIQDVKRIGDFTPMLVMLDRELGRQADSGEEDEGEEEA